MNMVQRIDLPPKACGKEEAAESRPAAPSVSQAPRRPWRDLLLGDGPLWMRFLAWASRNTRR